jgi:hypothetical protein
VFELVDAPALPDALESVLELPLLPLLPVLPLPYVLEPVSCAIAILPMSMMPMRVLSVFICVSRCWNEGDE